MGDGGQLALKPGGLGYWGFLDPVNGGFTDGFYGKKNQFKGFEWDIRDHFRDFAFNGDV